MKPLSPEQSEELKIRGFTLIKAAVPHPLVGAALRAINHRLGLIRDPRKEAASTGGIVSPAEMIFEKGPLMDLLYKSSLWPMALSLIGPKVERATQAQAVLRFPMVDPAGFKPQPHIDEYVPRDPPGTQARVSRFTLLACILLSDLPEPESGNPLVFPGSHVQAHRLLLRRGIDTLTHDLPRRLRLQAGVPIRGRAGDAVISHYLLAHDRQRNRSPHIRYAVYFRLRNAGHGKAQPRSPRGLWSEWTPGMRA